MPISKIKTTGVELDNLEIGGTEAASMPQGTTTERANAQVGDIRYNSTLDTLEQYKTTGWEGISSPPVITSVSPDNINESDTKKLSEKIIDLQKNFYFNDVNNNNSACFWCTCDFDHTPIHIPKYKLNEQYYVYGCFCSPECAVAHLMNESIDTSQKYERYQILNYLYNNIYNNTASIKPAPDPRYLLDKFMGNLTITEYRKLLRQDRLFMVVDKPITRILPEIYEETDLKGSQFENQQNKTSFQIKKSTSKLGVKKSFFS